MADVDIDPFGEHESRPEEPTDEHISLTPVGGGRSTWEPDRGEQETSFGGRYKTLSRHSQLRIASSKVNYSVGEHLYMLPSDMNLKIRLGTVRYNNKILVSDGKFILGKNDEVNLLETPVMKSHKGSTVVTQTVVTDKDSEKTAVTQE